MGEGSDSSAVFAISTSSPDCAQGGIEQHA
jgi:hypothetical protein